MTTYKIAGIAGTLATLLALTACTLIGLAIGADVDSKKAKIQQFSGWEAIVLPKETEMTVHLKNAQTFKGKFKGGVKANMVTDTVCNVLLLKTTSKIEAIPVREVEYVDVKDKGSSRRLIGAGIGLTTDIIVISSVVHKAFNPGPNSPGKAYSSCPYIYSNTGTGYCLDAELFSGAFFKSAERPDWVNLGFLKASVGVYRLNMTNELDETQHVDALQLLVADHPAGTVIYPSFEGQLYTLSKPDVPYAACDLRGNDVKDRIKPDDNAFWFASPFGRNPNQADAWRDGIILEFHRPEAATSLALLTRVQNTDWAPAMLRQVLDLPGRDLKKWFDTLNHSVEARNALMRSMIRESALRIHVWDGTNWRPGRYVWDVGSAVARNVVTEVDLSGIPGDLVKIKLESLPGFWIIHSVEADFTYYTIPSTVQELAPRSATDEHGRDVRPLLQRADNMYYDMPMASNVVQLEFDVPPQRRGTVRSLLLKSSGYYDIHIPASGEPQFDLLQQLVNEPGEFARFALNRVNQDAQRAVQSLGD